MKLCAYIFAIQNCELEKVQFCSVIKGKPGKDILSFVGLPTFPSLLRLMNNNATNPVPVLLVKTPTKA